MGGFIGGGGAIALSCMTKGYFFIQYPFFPERFQREPMGSEHATFESSPIPGELRTQRLPGALPLVNKLFLQPLLHTLSRKKQLVRMR
jgi:hypothetical protein